MIKGLSRLALLVLLGTFIMDNNAYSCQQKFRQRLINRRPRDNCIIEPYMEKTILPKKQGVMYRTPEELIDDIYRDMSIKPGQILKFDKEKAIDREFSRRFKEMEKYRPRISPEEEKRKYDDAYKKSIIEMKRLYDRI
jgi:hypothetical protein